MLNKEKKVIFIGILCVLIISISSIILNLINEKRKETEVMNLLNDSSTNPTKDSELYSEFDKLLHDLFDRRNNAILLQDTEGLKKFYNLNRKVSLWAYESEVKKIEYLNNWSEKQGATFSNIKSNIKLKKVREKETGLFGVICTVSTEFTYYYLNKPLEENSFKLGTYHYLNLKKEEDRYVINKEWYTDPFADSLDLNNIKTDEMKNFIMSHEKPEYSLNDRTKKAIEYAHKYFGNSVEDETELKYNSKYTDFNPQGGDCANFASQILFEGGGFKKNGTWNYTDGHGTTSWVNAQSFKSYMVSSGRASYIAKGSYQKIYKEAYRLRPGDIVAYEKKGRVVHVSTVTGMDSKGYPLVTCHNTDRLLVPYDLGWSNNSITFHLLDVHY